MKQYRFISVFYLIPIIIFGQDVELFKQFNGRYDYTAIGNTLNLAENGPLANCSIMTSSSADLVLNNNQTVLAAYLYWAGSGVGDFDITLNTIEISAERTFSDALDDTRQFFAAFANITDLIINQGSSTYTIDHLDLTSVIESYCPTGTNFAGWAIIVIYQDDNLPLNQINVYDGLQSVPSELTINLDNLNVLDNEGAKIGFIAWEGDNALSVNEQLYINGNAIGNPPLNPPDNAFNGTNSFTEETNLYNMDIDVYNIQNNIAIGDTSATIRLTSGQDFVMINNIITVLNSQLPDATIVTNNINIECNSRTIIVDYSVNNFNSTDTLPANTAIAFYANDVLLTTSSTNNDINIGASESSSVVITIPENINNVFNLRLVVDGEDTVTEIIETNNTNDNLINLQIVPAASTLPALTECDQGFNTATFDLTTQYENIFESPENISFHTTEEDALLNINGISIPESYTNSTSIQSIFIRIKKNDCFEIAVFKISVENCPPDIPDGVSPNGDGLNDDFNIIGLRDIFENYQLLIYNRYGTLVYKGNNSTPNWNGTSNQGINNKGKLLPTGVYFYVLNLNDENLKSLNGSVYLSR